MREELDSREAYLHSLLPQPESAGALNAKEQAKRWNKDKISISAYEAHLISFFIRNYACKKFVEFGTLTGYSGLKILESLPPEGHLWTFEINEECARLASTIFDEAGFKGKYTILVGKAEELVASIEACAPFDGVFIDANKSSYPFYLDWAGRNLKNGGMILADNVLLRGVVPEREEGESKSPSKMIQQLRLFNQKIMNSSLFDALILPTNEGLALAIKK